MASRDIQRERSEVLVVPDFAVGEFFREPQFVCDPESIGRILEAITLHGRFVDREWAEENSSVKQVVAYGVIRHDRQVLCLRRSRSTARDSLRLRYTLLVGGHVDNLEKDSSMPLETCLLRELDEELGLVPNCTPALIGIAVDPTTKVGQFHLGVVFDVPIQSRILDVASSHDNTEFVNASGHNRYELQTIDQILGLQFDSWSSLFLASQACERLFAKSNLQMRLPLHWSAS